MDVRWTYDARLVRGWCGKRFSNQIDVHAVFSNTNHKNMDIMVKYGKVEVDGFKLTVRWIEAFTDGSKKIASVEDVIGGKVALTDGSVFQNPSCLKQEMPSWAAVARPAVSSTSIEPVRNLPFVPQAERRHDFFFGLLASHRRLDRRRWSAGVRQRRIGRGISASAIDCASSSYERRPCRAMQGGTHEPVENALQVRGIRRKRMLEYSTQVALERHIVQRLACTPCRADGA